MDIKRSALILAFIVLAGLLFQTQIAAAKPSSQSSDVDECLLMPPGGKIYQPNTFASQCVHAYSMSNGNGNASVTIKSDAVNYCQTRDAGDEEASGGTSYNDFSNLNIGNCGILYRFYPQAPQSVHSNLYFFNQCNNIEVRIAYDNGLQGGRSIEESTNWVLGSAQYIEARINELPNCGSTVNESSSNPADAGESGGAGPVSPVQGNESTTDTITDGVVIAVVAAVVVAGVAGAAIVAGRVIAGRSPGTPAGGQVSPPTPAPPAGPVAVVVDQKVVTGQDAIDELVSAGAKKVGNCVDEASFAGVAGIIRGIAYTGSGTICADNVGIVKDWPHPADPTTQTRIKEGADIAKELVEIGFPQPKLVTADDGGVYVVPSENLPDHVAGIGHVLKPVQIGKETVMAIDPKNPVIIEYWPQPINITLDPIDTPIDIKGEPSREPPLDIGDPIYDDIDDLKGEPSREPPPEEKKAEKREITHIFRIRQLVAIEFGQFTVGMLVCAKIREDQPIAREGYLVYKGTGTGGGSPFSIMGPGSESQIEAERHMTLEQFAGFGSVGGIGGGFTHTLTASMTIFFCGDLPAVYWFSAGLGTGFGGSISTTLGTWTFHNTAGEALDSIMDWRNKSPLPLENESANDDITKWVMR